MTAVTPFLWFEKEAEEAARFYVSVLPDSRINQVQRSPADTPSGQAGAVLLVDFTVAGQRVLALNGGPHHRLTPAASLMVDCEDQAEVDRLWEQLGEGGQPGPCGWLTDRYGLSWQIVPKAFGRLLASGDAAQSRRVMQAMMGMGKFDIAALERAYAREAEAA